MFTNINFTKSQQTSLIKNQVASVQAIIWTAPNACAGAITQFIGDATSTVRTGRTTCFLCHCVKESRPSAPPLLNQFFDRNLGKLSSSYSRFRFCKHDSTKATLLYLFVYSTSLNSRFINCFKITSDTYDTYGVVVCGMVVLIYDDVICYIFKSIKRTLVI